MSHEVNCKHCGRYLCTAVGTLILEQIVCPNSKCKARLNIKIITSDSTEEQRNYRFRTKEQLPKEKI